MQGPAQPDKMASTSDPAIKTPPSLLLLTTIRHYNTALQYDLASRGPRNLRSRGTLPPPKGNLICGLPLYVATGAMKAEAEGEEPDPSSDVQLITCSWRLDPGH